MKEHRAEAMSGMKAKLARMGGKMGDRKHLEKGGKCYATGGAVGAANAGPIGGEAAPRSLSKPGKKKSDGKKKKGDGPVVNVVVMPKGDSPAPPMMPPPGPPPAMMPPPMPPKPPMPPPGAGPGGPPGMPPPGGPPGMGGPPMMHAHGGRVGRKSGGKVKRADGGEVKTLPRTGWKSLGISGDPEVGKRVHAARTVKENMENAVDKMTSGAPENEDSSIAGRKGGGKVKRAEGGSVRSDINGPGKVVGTKDGAGSGPGREEKMKMYGNKSGKATGMVK